MKLVSFKSNLAVVATLAVAGVLGASHLVIAQPATAPAKKGKRGRKSKSGLPAKTQAKIEGLLGKPLTADQKTQLDAASDTRRTALKAAQDKFEAEVARVTGLAPDQLKTPKKDKTPKA